MSISKTRSLLYLVARLLGDVNAVRKGKVARPSAEGRAAGKVAGRGLGRLLH